MNHSGEKASQATLDETMSQWGFMHRLCWTSIPGVASFASQSLSIARTTWHSARKPQDCSACATWNHEKANAFSTTGLQSTIETGWFAVRPFANFCLDTGWFDLSGLPAEGMQICQQWPVRLMICQIWFLLRLLWFRIRWLSWSGTSVFWFFHRQCRSACRSVSKSWDLVLGRYLCA